MIIDCHGHYTTAPPALQEYRDAQLARLADPTLPVPAGRRSATTRSGRRSRATSCGSPASAGPT